MSTVCNTDVALINGFRNSTISKRAEGEGFEPSKVSLAGFQDRCTRPGYATSPSGEGSLQGKRP
jgi:hypothetical protein